MPNAQVNLPGPPQRQHTARNQTGAAISFIRWFGGAAGTHRFSKATTMWVFSSPSV
jgi:hypothetical protein